MKKAVWLIIVLLAACSAPQTRDTLDAGEARSGASVGLLPINDKQALEAKVFDNIVGLAGTAGRLAVFKGEETRQRRLRETLKGESFDYRQRLASTLDAALRDAGIALEPVRFRRTIDNVLGEVPPGRFEKRPPKNSGKDYLLDIHVDLVGYISPGLNKPYLPTLHVGARLLEGDSLNEVYRTRIEYHPLDAEDATIGLPVDDQYAFDDTEAMAADPKRTAAGLAAAMEAVVRQLRADLVPLARG